VINYVTANNIHDMIDGKNTDWIVKQDIPDYDHTRQCVKFAQKKLCGPPFFFLLSSQALLKMLRRPREE
jgi:hypothetical protein